ncbi:RAP protein, putative [Plasmodium relictum]|uniref:RAP protein, putative n=1 Tax=Plasmodium relictum TaxID=85471 RepID=A0A1J1HF51_PLARL|nr:RAP protein, putative [Plasmodium relictum]CRH02493.1 RAP protein, putative [Plasmodium relictum]
MKLGNLISNNTLKKNLLINYKNDVSTKYFMCSLNAYTFEINYLNKVSFNKYEKRFIRVGKYADLINYKSSLKNKNENTKNEKNKSNEKQTSIFEILNNNELEISQPKKYKKKIENNDDKKKGNEDEINLNYSLCENRKMETSKKKINTINKSLKNQKDSLKKRYKKQIINKIMNNNNIINIEQITKDKEKKNMNENITEYNEKKINNFNNKYVTKRKLLKKQISLNSYAITNSYVNKKYYISIKKNLKENDFNISEIKSMQLLDEVKKINERKDEKKEMKNEIKEFQIDSVSYENKNKIIKKIYKASINHVRDENLWKKYVQNTFIVSVYLDASDIVILFWCFSKIGYRDNRLINLLCSIILKKINELSACALSLLLNSFKKLEIKKYDTIELLTNQFCFHTVKWTFQDIALVSNALAFFYIYHKTFWKKCILKLQHNYYFSHPLHLCLVISSFARLDIREGNILLCMSKSAKKLAKEFSPNNLSLVIHSFAKLKFHHPKFYNYMYQYVHKHLDKQLLINGYNAKSSSIHFSKTSEEEVKEKDKDISFENNRNFNNLNINITSGINKNINDKLKPSERSSNNNLINQNMYNSCVNDQNKNKDRIFKEKDIIIHSETQKKNGNYDKVDEENINNASNGNLEKLVKKDSLFDLQSLVLLLFSCVCLINCTQQMILKLTYLIIPHKDYLGDHKVDKLKYVSDYLQYVFPSTFEKFPKEIKDFYKFIDNYEIKRKKLKYCPRWINELSRILMKINVDHLKNIYINNICADIMLTDSNVIIKCLGPYSYYVNSLVSTSISDLKIKILEKKKYKVITLSYHDWNNLNDYEEKINFLYAFGRNAANFFFLNSKKEGLHINEKDNINTTDNILLKEKNENELKDKKENSIEHKNSVDDSLEDTEIENYFSDEESEIINFIKNVKSANEENTNIDEEITNIKNFLTDANK